MLQAAQVEAIQVGSRGEGAVQPKDINRIRKPQSLCNHLLSCVFVFSVSNN